MAHHVQNLAACIALDTVNNTPIVPHDFTPPAGTNMIVRATAAALGLTTGDVAGWVVMANFTSSALGVVTRAFVPINVYRQRNDPTWDCTLITDGTAVQVQITGDSGETVEWAVKCEGLLNEP
ncbi:MAG: hypothetical protein JRD89_19520 [Deltaproteobacteria bacterium]|nr:hypothetical protein [Deltaproteobacteria bacterium]